MRKDKLRKGLMVFSKEGIPRGIIWRWWERTKRHTIVEVLVKTQQNGPNHHLATIVKYPIRCLYIAPPIRIESIGDIKVKYHYRDIAEVKEDGK